MSEDIFEEEEQIAQEQASVEAHVLRQTMRDLPTPQPPKMSGVRGDSGAEPSGRPHGVCHAPHSQRRTLYPRMCC